MIIDMKGFTGARNVQVYNEKGRLIKSIRLLNAMEYKMDVSEMNRGVYVLYVSDEAGHVKSAKWIKE